MSEWRPDRRRFLVTAVTAAPASLVTQSQGPGEPVRVTAGEDRFGEHKRLGISTIDFKVTAADSRGAMLVIENTNRAAGGPPRHRHDDQDELFYVIEGDYLIEVGARRFVLKPGDSLLAPRRVPHVWAYTGKTQGRILITFTPPGQMEAFFLEVSKRNAMPPQDPAFWRRYGMEVLGPPLQV